MPVAPRVALNRTANATASAATTLKQMQQTLQDMASSMQSLAGGHAALASSVEKAATGHKSLNESVVKSGDQAQGSLKGLNGILGETGGVLGTIWGKVNKFWEELTGTDEIHRLQKQLAGLTEQRQEAAFFEKQARDMGDKAAAKNYANTLREVAGNTRAVQSNLRLAEAVHRLGQEKRDLIEITEAAFEIELLELVLKLNAKYADFLQQANSSLEARNRLLNIGLSVQLATGQSYEQIGPAMKEMVALGLENNRNFRNNLTTAVMLERALGVSATNSARLAQQAEYTHTSFQKMGNVLSEVAQTTALTADEAARFATEIGKALQTFAGSEGQSRFPQIAREVLLFAGSLKEVGGNAEDVLKLFQGIQSGKNLTAAALLGVSNFSMDSTRSVKQLENGLANLSRQMDSGSLAARVTMSTYAEMMGVEESTLRLSALAIRARQEQEAKYGALMHDNELLQKNYNAQMVQLGQVLPMLRNMFMSLTYVGLTPLLLVVQRISLYVLNMAQALAASRQFLQVLQVIGSLFTVVLIVGIVRATFALIRFAAALGDVVIAASRRIKVKDSGEDPDHPSLWSRGTSGVSDSLGKIGWGIAGVAMLGAGAVATYNSIMTLNQTVANITSEYRKHGLTVALFGTVMGRATELVGGLTAVFFGAKYVFTGILGVFQLLYSSIVAVVGLAFNPMVWVTVALVAALAAFGAGLVYYRKWLIEGVQALGKWVANFLGFANVQAMWDKFTENFFGVFGARNWDDFKKDWYNHLMWGAGIIVGTLWRWSEELYKYLTGPEMWKDLGKLWEGMKFWGPVILGVVVDAVTRWANDLYAFLSSDEMKARYRKVGDTLAGYWKSFTDMISGVGDVGANIWGWVKREWSTFTTYLLGLFNAMVSGVVAWGVGITVRVDKLFTSVEELVKSAQDLVKTLKNVADAMEHPGNAAVKGLKSMLPSWEDLGSWVPDLGYGANDSPNMDNVRRTAYQPAPIVPLSRNDTDSPALRALTAMAENTQAMLETAQASHKVLDRMDNRYINVDNTFSNALSLQGMTTLAAPIAPTALV